MFWINALRVLVGGMCILSMIIMIGGYFRHRKHWNEKTIDYWYGRLMWSVVGLSACIEGFARDSSFRYTFVFTTVAVIVTLKGNLQKGKWGNDDEEHNDD